MSTATQAGRHTSTQTAAARFHRLHRGGQYHGDTARSNQKQGTRYPPTWFFASEFRIKVASVFGVLYSGSVKQQGNLCVLCQLWGQNVLGTPEHDTLDLLCQTYSGAPYAPVDSLFVEVGSTQRHARPGRGGTYLNGTGTCRASKSAQFVLLKNGCEWICFSQASRSALIHPTRSGTFFVINCECATGDRKFGTSAACAS